MMCKGLKEYNHRPPKKKKNLVPSHEKCSLSMGEVFCLDVMRYCHAVVQCRTSRATPMQPVPFYNVLALDQFPLPSIAPKPIINESPHLTICIKHTQHHFHSPLSMNRIRRNCIKWHIKEEEANMYSSKEMVIL